jgi:hypothetical protein
VRANDELEPWKRRERRVRRRRTIGCRIQTRQAVPSVSGRASRFAPDAGLD